MWNRIDDDTILHVWIDSKGIEHEISPAFYERNGTPIDEGTGEDMMYSHTILWSEDN